MYETVRALRKIEHKWLVFGVVALSIIMNTLDASIVNVALPVMRAEFKADITVIEWVVTSYLLTITALLMVFGRMADIYGRKRIFSLGIALFTIGSALCALSNTIYWLIASRALQGVGAACTMANGNPIVTEIFPPQQRGKVLGWVGTTVAVGLSAGPVLGGVITTYFGWRCIFLFNLPLGIAAYYFTRKYLPRAEVSGNARFDFAGAITLTLTITALLLALTEYANWGIAAAISLGVIFILLLASFIYTEGKAKAPMIELGMFRDNRFSHANLAAFLNFAARTSVIFLLPFYLVDFRGLLPSQAGLLLTPVPLLFAFIAPISGSLSDRIGTRLLTTSGMLMTALGFSLLAFIQKDSGVIFILASLTITGIGGGLFSSPNVSTIMGSVPPNRLGNAGAMSALVRNLGMIVGVAWSGAMFTAIRGHGNEFIHTSDRTVPALQATMVVSVVIALLSAWASFRRGEIHIHQR